MGTGKNLLRRMLHLPWIPVPIISGAIHR